MDSVDYAFGRPDGSGRRGAGARGDALRRLLAATNGLLRLELDVVQGAPLDADALDDLLGGYCAAVYAVAHPRTDSEEGADPGAPSGRAAPAEEEEAPAEPTPRLEFARWLVRHGRLSG